MKPQNKSAITRMEHAKMFFGDRVYGSPWLTEKYLKAKLKLKKKKQELNRKIKGEQGTFNFS